MAKTAYVAFGGNLGDSRKTISDAYEALGLVPGIKTEALSDIIETKPWGYENQENFCNACARLSVDISPQALLGVCLGIEAAMGRKRIIRNGPRVIDIDVIIYENETIDSEELKLPHPRMWERDFVLVPLYQVAEETIKEMISEAIKKLKEHFVV